MKKLNIISNQIKNNTYSYTGKGAFEAVVNNYKYEIITWLDELLPLQKQIELLQDMANVYFQKRNYTRILTKLLPDEYKEFVSINILVRDANTIAQYYKNEFNVTILFDQLIEHQYLKYPGKYEKYVEFEIFQKFIMMYRDELMESLDHKITTKTSKEPILDKVIEELDNETIENDTPEKIEKFIHKKDNKWTNLLLGKK